MKKFEIINQSVVVTDTVSGKTVFDAPKNETYYNLESLQELTPPYIQLIDKSGTNSLSGNYACELSEAVNSTLVAFTVETFKDFARANLGFKTASGGSGAVDSVNGQTGDVVLSKSDVGLGNVDNTSDANKPISIATQDALDGKQNTITNPVTGLGVANQVSFWNSASNQTGDNGFVWDNVDKKLLAQKLTVIGDMEIGQSSSDYRKFRIGGGNSSGYIYGAFATHGDGIHFGYNYYSDNVSGIIPAPFGPTSRLTAGYGFIEFATGVEGVAPTARARVLTTGFQFVNVPIHANNTAAAVAGLVQGNVYHTGDGVLRVVI